MAADGLNEEIIWPPVQVFADGVADGGYCREDYQSSSKVLSRRNYLHSPSPVAIKSPPTQPPPLPLVPSQTSSKPCPKPRPHMSTWTVGGPGMQAVFLDSGQKSFGTGVFLPRRAGPDPKPGKKPAFAPVLLPSRVVQALNLNVHELGLQIKPRDGKNNSKKEDLDRRINRKKKENEVTPSQSCVISQSRSSSPEIFLPKEWTY